jgi:hypothetical protein
MAVASYTLERNKGGNIVRAIVAPNGRPGFEVKNGQKIHVRKYDQGLNIYVDSYSIRFIPGWTPILEIGGRTTMGLDGVIRTIAEGVFELI